MNSSLHHVCVRCNIYKPKFDLVYCLFDINLCMKDEEQVEEGGHSQRQTHSPNTVLAGTDSLFNQKDTWERMTVMMHGRYVWMTK